MLFPISLLRYLIDDLPVRMRFCVLPAGQSLHWDSPAWRQPKLTGTFVQRDYVVQISLPVYSELVSSGTSSGVPADRPVSTRITSSPESIR